MNQEGKRECPAEEGKNRLLILINHWIKHNYEHTSEYLSLAENLESQGLSGIAGSIRNACVLVLQANDSLSGAKNTLAQYQPNPTIPKSE